VLAALVLSVAGHGLVLGLLWLCPGSASSPQVAVLDTAITVSLASLAPAHALPSGAAEEAANPHPSDEIVFVRPSGTIPAASGSGQSDEAPVLMGGPGLSPGGPRQGGSRPAAGPARRLLSVPASAHSVVYLIDRSVSMALHDALPMARQAVAQSLAALPPGARFQIIAYNEQAELLHLQGSTGLLPAEPANLALAQSFLDSLTASGFTRHLPALQLGLTLQPDVLFLVTDADDLTPTEVQTITRLNQGRTRIDTLELSRRRPRPESLLARLARGNGGSYRCISPRP
jgi:hypothetical protein